MTFKNNARTQNVWAYGASDTSITVTTWEGALFPTSFPFKATWEHYESGVVTKREIITVTNIVWDLMTITRTAETCVQDDSASPKTRTNNAYSFSDWDYISQYITEDDYNAIWTAINTTIPATYATKAEVAEWDLVYNASSVWTDAYQVNITNVDEYKNGLKIYVKADVANTWACTLEVNSLWAVAVKNLQWTEDLTDWEWGANWIASLIYNSTWPVWQFSWQEAVAPVIETTPYVFWDWSDWALSVTSWTTTLNLDQVYNYSSIEISAGATLNTWTWSWNLILKCNWNCNIDWTIEHLWSLSWTDISLETIFVTYTPDWTPWTWWNGWNGWEAYNWTWWVWSWGTWSALWYGWGWWGWEERLTSDWPGGAGWTWGTPGGIWWATDWWAGWLSAWWGGWWNSWWVWANAYGLDWWNYQSWSYSAWWGGWSGWTVWLNGGWIIIYAKSFSWTWTVRSNWLAGQDWWNWGEARSSAQLPGAWGWGWGGWGWAGGMVILIWNDWTFWWTITTNWWTGWNGWSAGAVGTAWTIAATAWATWNATTNNVNKLLSDFI